MTTAERRRGTRRWWIPWAARTRIIGWVLLLVLVARAVVTLVTWRLQIRQTDERTDLTLDAEVFEFRQVVGSGNDPRTGEPFAPSLTSARP